MIGIRFAGITVTVGVGEILKVGSGVDVFKTFGVGVEVDMLIAVELGSAFVGISVTLAEGVDSTQLTRNIASSKTTRNRYTR